MSELVRRRGDGSMHVFDDFREAYSWLRHNTPEDAKVSSQASLMWTRFDFEQDGRPLLAFAFKQQPNKSCLAAIVGSVVGSGLTVLQPQLRTCRCQCKCRHQHVLPSQLVPACPTCHRWAAGGTTGAR